MSDTHEMKSGYRSGLMASAFELLVHYYYTPEHYPGVMHNPMYSIAMSLMSEGLMNWNFTLTERGKCLAEHIVNLPLPSHSWKME